MSPTIHTVPQSFRTAKALIAAQYNGVQVNVPADFQMGVTNRTPEFLAKFPAGTVPAMEDGDFYLNESSGIAYYGKSTPSPFSLAQRMSSISYTVIPV